MNTAQAHLTWPPRESKGHSSPAGFQPLTSTSFVKGAKGKTVPFGLILKQGRTRSPLLAAPAGFWAHTELAWCWQHGQHPALTRMLSEFGISHQSLWFGSCSSQ